MTNHITAALKPVKNKRIIWIAVATLAILAIPLVAMRFTAEVNWTFSDFVFAGALIFGIGLTFELIATRANMTSYKVATALALAGTFLLIWINGAVGVIGSEDNPANLLYGGVLAVLIIGTLISQLKPIGLYRTLLLTALTQALVPVVALLIFKPSVASWDPGVTGIFILSFFVVLWVAAGLLFRQSSLRRL